MSMSRSDRIGLTGLAITLSGLSLWYFVGSVFLAVIVAVVWVGLLRGWLSAEIHGRFAAAVARPGPPAKERFPET
jgi:hypothetical protein